MKRLTPRELMEKIKEDRKLSNRTKEEWFAERNRVDLQTKKAKENETEKEKVSRLRLRNEYALTLSQEEIELVTKSHSEDEKESRFWREAELRRPIIRVGPRGGMYYQSGRGKRYI